MTPELRSAPESAGQNIGLECSDHRSQFLTSRECAGQALPGLTSLVSAPLLRSTIFLEEFLSVRERCEIRNLDLMPAGTPATKNI